MHMSQIVLLEELQLWARHRGDNSISHGAILQLWFSLNI